MKRLIAQIAQLTGETEIVALKRALEERRARLAYGVASQIREARLRTFLEQELWPAVPGEEEGRRLTRAEEGAILGYGAEGV